jgi:hypothetical protein
MTIYVNTTTNERTVNCRLAQKWAKAGYRVIKEK